MEKDSKDKKYNAILGIMIFLFVVILAVILAWGLGFITINSNKSIGDTTTQTEGITELTTNIEKKDNSNEQTDVNKNDTNDIVIDNNTINNIDLKIGKCLNDPQDITYELSTLKHNHGVYVTYKSDKIYFGINNDELKNDGCEVNIEKYKEYEITGINVNGISEIYISGWGQTINYPMVVFLMKDGTVEWLNSQDAIVNKDFVVEGKISNAEKVVRITNADSGRFGGLDLIGVRADGDFYNLCLETVNKR